MLSWCANHNSNQLGTAKLTFLFQMISNSNDNFSNKVLSKPQIPDNKDSVCAACPLSPESECDENTPGGAQDPQPTKSCMQDGTSQSLVFHTYHTLKPLLRAHCCSQRCSLLGRKPRSQCWGYKDRIVSAQSFSAPAAAAPRLHFPSALSCSHCSCCFSCCSLPLSSRCSLLGRGSRFMFP